MAARIKRESCGWQSSWTQRLTRKFFSWIILRACEKCGFGSTQCFYSLPERPKLRDLSEDQNHKSPVQNTHWRSRTSCREFWWLDNSISQSSQWKLWISKQSPICSRGARLGHPMDPVVSVQNKNFSGNTKGACKSSWSRIGSLKSFTLTIPWNLAKPVKIFPGIIVRRHHADRKKWDCWESSAQSKRRYVCSIVAIRSGWKVGGQIPWNALPICETFKTSCLMGKLHTRDVLENLLKDQSFRLVHWLSITLSLRRTSQESIILERKSYLDCSLDTLCTPGEFGRVTYWLQTLRSWKRWTHRKSTVKDSMQRK